MKTILTGLLLFLLCAGCGRMSPDPLINVNELLANKIVVEANFGGQVFCAHDVLALEMQEDGADVYVWALCGEYYLENGLPVLGTAGSLPVALHLVRGGETYALASYELPLDGTGYGASIEEIFPAEAIRKMCEGQPAGYDEQRIACFNERAERLEADIEQQAWEYFGVK